MKKENGESVSKFGGKRKEGEFVSIERKISYRFGQVVML